MRKELNPGVATAIIVVFVVVVAVFLYRAVMTGPGNKAPGEIGNPGPFAPGGAANSKAEPKKH
jgi:hypothetical protein